MDKAGSYAIQGIGLQFEVQVSDVDETPLASESPEEMVRRLAHAKAYKIAEANPNAFVIGADTTVVLGDQILGKPESHEDAVRMLSLIQGRTHTVWGAFSIINLEEETTHLETHSSRVLMCTMDQAQINSYVNTGEPMDKAGSYAIQGIGLQFVSAIEGSYSNIVGLNISALMRALKLLGAI